MTKLFSTIAVIALVLFGANSAVAQQIHPKIQEVFGNKTQQLVDDPQYLAFLTDYVENRVKIIESKYSADDKYTKLSSVSLLNKYNTGLSRDTQFDPQNFNPLKYDFIMSSKSAIIYRVDNTDYLIVIHPQTIKQD